MRIAVALILIVGLGACSDASVMGGEACVRRTQALRQTYAKLADTDVQGGVMGVANAVQGMDSDTDPDSADGRRQQRQVERAMRAHTRNLRLMERATDEYERAKQAGCPFVPPPPYGGRATFAL